MNPNWAWLPGPHTQAAWAAALRTATTLHPGEPVRSLKVGVTLILVSNPRFLGQSLGRPSGVRDARNSNAAGICIRAGVLPGAPLEDAKILGRRSKMTCTPPGLDQMPSRLINRCLLGKGPRLESLTHPATMRGGQKWSNIKLFSRTLSSLFGLDSMRQACHAVRVCAEAVSTAGVNAESRLAATFRRAFGSKRSAVVTCELTAKPKTCIPANAGAWGQVSLYPTPSSGASTDAW